MNYTITKTTSYASPFKPNRKPNQWRLTCRYWIQGNSNRFEVRKVITAKDKTEAGKEAVKFAVRIEDGTIPVEPFRKERVAKQTVFEAPVSAALTLKEAYFFPVRGYRDRLIARNSPATTIVNTDNLFAKHIFPVLGNYAVESVNSTAINVVLKNSLKAKIDSGELAGQTADNYLSRLKACLSGLIRSELRIAAIPPLEFFDSETEVEHKHKIITPADFDQALVRAASVPHPVLAATLKAFVFLSCAAGLRLGEVLGLVWSRVNLIASTEYPNGFVLIDQQQDSKKVVRDTKGRRKKKKQEQRIPLSSGTRDSLLNLQAVRGHHLDATDSVILVEKTFIEFDGFVLQRRARSKATASWVTPARGDLFDQVEKSGKRVGWMGFLFGHGNHHAMRHHFVTQVVNSAVSIKHASKLARHSSVLTTEKYLDTTVSDMSAGIEKAFPSHN
jgi:integrase